MIRRSCPCAAGRCAAQPLHISCMAHTFRSTTRFQFGNGNPPLPVHSRRTARWGASSGDNAAFWSFCYALRLFLELLHSCDCIELMIYEIIKERIEEEELNILLIAHSFQLNRFRIQHSFGLCRPSHPPFVGFGESFPFTYSIHVLWISSSSCSSLLLHPLSFHLFIYFSLFFCLELHFTSLCLCPCF